MARSIDIAPGLRRTSPLEREDAFRRSPWRRWIARGTSETVAVLLLALAALATAWSSYQASLWSGIQAAEYSTAQSLRSRAGRAADRAARLRLVDALLFTKWLEAKAARREQLALLYERHFRPEFRLAFADWRDEVRLSRTDAPTPFEHAAYDVASSREAAQYDDAANQAFTRGQVANNYSDAYVFDTVILATVLFFAGALRPLVKSSARGVVMVLALSLFAWAVLRLFAEPVAS